MQAPTSLVLRIFDLAFNQGDLAIIDELVAADKDIHIINWRMPSSWMSLKQLIASFRLASPDLTVSSRMTGLQRAGT